MQMMSFLQSRSRNVKAAFVASFSLISADDFVTLPDVMGSPHGVRMHLVKWIKYM